MGWAWMPGCLKIKANMEFHVILISDESYARGLAVTLRSLLDSLRVDSTDGSKAKTSQAAHVLQVWLLDTGLSAETWTRLRRMVQDHSTATCSVRLHHIPAQLHGAAVTLLAWDGSISTTSPSTNTSSGDGACRSHLTHTSAPEVGTHAATAAVAAAAAAAAAAEQDNRVTLLLPPCDSYASQSCWLKLLIPQLLPPDVQCALYLDCDMLVKEDPCSLLEEAHSTFEVRTHIHLAEPRAFEACRACVLYIAVLLCGLHRLSLLHYVVPFHSAASCSKPPA
jgi:lipopolysaccharide biosynthesis glycosyltransferase